VLADVDADAVLEQALTKRLRGRAKIGDQKEFNRLYRYFVGQGYEADRVLAALRKYNKSDDLE
jgi:SOS response regulatory protein OraA/RecX